MEFQNQARFHPLKFLKEIAKGLTVYEETPVEKVEHHGMGNNKVVTKNGTVTAGKVIFACHFPFVNLPGYYFARMYQERSYAIAFENAMCPSGCYLGIDQEGYSFRTEGNLLILGGGSHRTGENSQGGKYDKIRKKARELFPGCKEVASWSAQDCITLDHIPYIGAFDRKSQDWFVATGFGKWGMTSAMVSAKVLPEVVDGKEIPEADIFSPQRKISALAMKELAVNTGITAANFTKQLVSVNRIKSYTENDKVFEVSIRCPHLGCKLSWNPDERTWECPCHGSRFDYRGRLLDNPAQIGIER